MNNPTIPHIADNLVRLAVAMVAILASESIRRNIFSLNEISIHFAQCHERLEMSWTPMSATFGDVVDAHAVAFYDPFGSY
jgi:hypothetical protein